MSETNDRELTLDDIKEEKTADVKPSIRSSEDLTGAKPINIADHVSNKPSKEDEMVAKEMAELDEGISRFLGEINEERDRMYEEEIQNAIENDEDLDAVLGPSTYKVEASATVADDDDIDLDDNDTASPAPANVVNLDLDSADSIDSIKFLDEEDDEDLGSPEEEENLKEFKEVIKKKVIPINNPVNLAQFTVSKKAIGISKVLSANSQKAKHAADWVLYTSKRPISMQEIPATDLEKFNPNSSSRNRLNMYKDMYEVVYNNLIDPNKPSTFEAWTKSVNFFDLPHLYFTIYKANFGPTSTIPYTCPKCNKISMVDVDIEKMIKYSTPEVKAEVSRILSRDTTSPESIDSLLIQLSDDYACTLSYPTVYSVIFENAALDQTFTNKYSDLLGIISYIEEMYFVDKNSNQLIPISTNPDPSNLTKTVKRKVKSYNEILKTLTSDQYNYLLTNMKTLNDKGEGIEYCKPEVNCPECGEIIPESIEDPLALLFTRHQLVALASL